jgi:hypothetical protein
MAAHHQELLKKTWTEGKKGSLSALAQAKAWALREVWRGEDKPEFGMLAFIQSRVDKIGGGSPSPSALGC